MSSIDLFVASLAPFSADTGADTLSDHPGLNLTNDPLGLAFDLGESLPLTLLGNGQTGITWEIPAGQGNSSTSPGRSQEDQQKPIKFERPGDAEKESQTQMIQASSQRYRSKANVTSDFQTKVDQRERFLESNRLAASRCRQKKRDHTKRLETRFTEEKQKKKQLESDIAVLRDEVLSLKDDILKHALCEDGHIRQHFARTMQQITHSNNTGILSPSISASSSGSSLPASLINATSLAATAASLHDEFSSGVFDSDKGELNDINGDTISLPSENSHSLVDETGTDLIHAYTYLI